MSPRQTRSQSDNSKLEQIICTLVPPRQLIIIEYGSKEIINMSQAMGDFSTVPREIAHHLANILDKNYENIKSFLTQLKYDPPGSILRRVVFDKNHDIMGKISIKKALNQKSRGDEETIYFKRDSQPTTTQSEEDIMMNRKKQKEWRKQDLQINNSRVRHSFPIKKGEKINNNMIKPPS